MDRGDAETSPDDEDESGRRAAETSEGLRGWHAPVARLLNQRPMGRVKLKALP